MEGEPAPPPPACSLHQATATPSSSCCTFIDSSLSSSSSTLAEISDDLFELQKNRLLCDLQGSINRYNDCYCLLQREIDELNLLRQEKFRLMSDFVELSGLLDDQKKKMNTTGLGFAPGKENVSPSVSGKRIPKSISIRSTGFLAVKNPAGGSPRSDGAGSSGEVKLPHRLLVPVPRQGEGKVLVAGGGGAVEMDVYDQGMTKTELCNKWEEMAWCPYGQQCQFAHGIQELRPVIRHPRYKTQLCRMVGLPSGCPYGHRCHFRHASEKHDPK